jgi:hemolysin activation/secretion protein
VSPILKPGRTPGSLDVELSVKDQLPLHGDVEVDNYSSPFTNQDRASASIHYDNLWQRQHSLAISYQAAPAAVSESSVWSGTYLWRFADSDDVVTAYAIHSNSNIAVVGSATILGKATIYGARWIKPIGSGFSQGANFFNTLTFGIDRKDFGQTNIDAQTGALEPLPPIDYSPISLTYGATLVRDAGIVQFSIGPSTAPRGLFGNSDAEFRGRRVLGGASYLAWKADFSAEQWFGRHVSAYSRFSGQWTADPLIPNEQFITGGGDSVRGYRESEVSGDRGLQGTLELRGYPLGRPPPDGKRLLYVELFADGADVRNIEPQGPQIPGIGIASAGLGVHGQGWYGLHADVDLARTLRDGAKGVHGLITPSGAWRLDFKVGDSF